LVRILVAAALFLKSIEYFTKNNLVEKIQIKKKTIVETLSIMNNIPIKNTKEGSEQETKANSKSTRQFFTKQNLRPWIYLFSALFVFTGLFLKLISAIWIVFLTINLRKTRDVEIIYMLAFFIVMLFLGAGIISLDKIF